MCTAGFEVLLALNINVAVLWVVLHCRLVRLYQHFTASIIIFTSMNSFDCGGFGTEMFVFNWMTVLWKLMMGSFSFT
jgi:hypothetical protein